MSSPQSPRTPDAVDKAWESDPGRSSCGVFRKAVYVAYLKNTRKLRVKLICFVKTLTHKHEFI